MLFYIFVYTIWLKPRSPQNIVIGGAAGAVPALVGWAAVTNSLSVSAWVMFAIVFCWTPPHFWALSVRYREDYAKAGIPMLPVVVGTAAAARQILVYAIVTVVVSFALVPVSGVGWIYGITALVLGVMFVGRGGRAAAQAHARDRAEAVPLLEHVPRVALRRHRGRRHRSCGLTPASTAASSSASSRSRSPSPPRSPP